MIAKTNRNVRMMSFTIADQSDFHFWTDCKYWMLKKEVLAVRSQLGVSLYWDSKGHLKCQLGVKLFANTQTWAFPAPERQNHKKIMSCHNPPDRRSNSHKQTVSGFFRPFFATISWELCHDCSANIWRPALDYSWSANINSTDQPFFSCFLSPADPNFPEEF